MTSSPQSQKFVDDVRQLALARHPIIHVTTFEEDRLLDRIGKLAADLDRDVLVWSTSRGVYRLDGKTRPHEPAHAHADHANADLVAAIEIFEKIAAAKTGDKKIERDGWLFVLLDPYPYLTDRSANPIYRRRLRDLAINIRTKGYHATCVMVSPSANIPYELEKEVTVMDFPLPSQAEVRSLVTRFVKVAENMPTVSVDHSHELREALVNAALGLTYMEIQSALAGAIADDRCLDFHDVERIFRQKQQIVRKTGILDYCDTRGLSLEHVGGLARLKGWLVTRQSAFSEDGRAYGIKPPRGVLLTGVPGCGKSWAAKCVAASWRLPLIRLDMGKVYSSLIGSSEEHLRRAVQTAEAVAPCVLWIDEIEKGLSASRGYIGDSGVSLRVLGGFLTWLQEKTASVFVFATANQIELLPSELLRKGRFDEIFFVDLPSDEERRDIIRIHLRQARRDPARFDLDELVDLSGGARHGAGIALTGAEIETWVNEALIRSFRAPGAPGHDLAMDDFRAVSEGIVPLARMRAEDIRRMREWATDHAVRASDGAIGEGVRAAE